MLPFGLYLSVWPNRSNARTWFAQTFWLFDTIFANSSVPEVQVFFFSSKLYEKPTKNSIKLVLKSKRTHSIVLTEASSHFHAVLFFFFVELCSALSRTLGHTSALLAHSLCSRRIQVSLPTVCSPSKHLLEKHQMKGKKAEKVDLKLPNEASEQWLMFG